MEHILPLGLFTPLYLCLLTGPHTPDEHVFYLIVFKGSLAHLVSILGLSKLSVLVSHVALLQLLLREQELPSFTRGC